MDSVKRTGNLLAATIIMWTAVCIGAIALVLWALQLIAPPISILAGGAAILVILAAGRRRRSGG